MSIECIVSMNFGHFDIQYSKKKPIERFAVFIFIMYAIIIHRGCFQGENGAIESSYTVFYY